FTPSYSSAPSTTFILSAPLILLSLFFFNATATTEIYTLSLHDALPICAQGRQGSSRRHRRVRIERRRPRPERAELVPLLRPQDRSEEHTSELQSLTNLVCRLLLEKKKKNKN